MTVTSTSLGTNTVDINISGEQNTGTIITSIDTFLVAQGWAQYDIITPVNALFAYQRIYRSANFDGTFKYMQLFFYPQETKIFIDYYESWNNVTHVGTNKCYWGPMDVGAYVQYSYTGCDIIIMANTHWCVFQTFVNNQPGPWVGCFEVQRDAVEDTTLAGYPCWFATTSYKLGNGGVPVYAANTALESGVNGQAQHTVSFPRTTYGTGYLASMHSGISTPYWGSGAPGGSASPVTWAGNLLAAAANTFGSYAWNTANKIASSFRPRVQNELHGRAIGPKLTGAQYPIYNKISIPIDINFMYSSTGTATDHWALQSHLLNFRGALQSSVAPSATATMVINSLGAYKKIYLAGNGFYYALTTTGVLHKINVTSLALTVVTVAALQDICFDGRYIFGCAQTINGAIYSIDTTLTDTVVTGVVMGASTTAMTIAVDDTNLWIGCQFTNQAKVMQVLKANLTVIAFTTSLTGATVTQYPVVMHSDNEGNIIIGTGPGLLNGTVVYTTCIYKVAPGGIQTTNSYPIYAATLGMLYSSFRKTVCIGTGWVGSNAWLSGYSLSTDTLATSINMLITGGNIASGAYTQWNSAASPLAKMSVIGSCLMFQTPVANYLGAIYLNTGVNAGYMAQTNQFNIVPGDTSFGSYGEVKYNMWFGGNNTNLYILTNIFRADDGYANTTLGAVGAGRLLLPV